MPEICFEAGGLKYGASMDWFLSFRPGEPLQLFIMNHCYELSYFWIFQIHFCVDTPSPVAGGDERGFALLTLSSWQNSRQSKSPILPSSHYKHLLGTRNCRKLHISLVGVYMPFCLNQTVRTMQQKQLESTSCNTFHSSLRSLFHLVPHSLISWYCTVSGI